MIDVLMVGYDQRTSDIVRAVIEKNYRDISLTIVDNTDDMYKRLMIERVDVVITKSIDILMSIKKDRYALFVLIFADDTDKSFIVRALNEGADYFLSFDDNYTTYLILGQIIYSLAKRLVTENREYMRMKNEINIFSKLIPRDINSDIKFILSNARVLEMLYKNEDSNSYIDVISSICERMITMLDDISSSDMTEEHNFIDILRGIAGISKRTYPNIDIHVNTKIDYTVNIMGSRLLPAVFYNLIKNSVKYAGEGCKIDIDVTDTGDYVEVIVADDGPGISMEKSIDIFERSSRVSGGGLGLYLSKEIISYNKGMITLLDTDRGAAFKIVLPIINKR